MRIKELRTKANITQKQLAEYIGVTSQTILNWENGIFEPKISELIKLANYFHVSVDYLIEREVDNSQINIICDNLRQIEKEDFIEFIKKELNK